MVQLATSIKVLKTLTPLSSGFQTKFWSSFDTVQSCPVWPKLFIQNSLRWISMPKIRLTRFHLIKWTNRLRSREKQMKGKKWFETSIDFFFLQKHNSFLYQTKSHQIVFQHEYLSRRVLQNEQFWIIFLSKIDPKIKKLNGNHQNWTRTQPCIFNSSRKPSPSSRDSLTYIKLTTPWKLTTQRVTTRPLTIYTSSSFFIRQNAPRAPSTLLIAS